MSCMGGTNLVLPDGPTTATRASYKVKAALVQMTKGGVIMDVTTPLEAIMAQEAGACAVIASNGDLADCIREGGVARMSDPQTIKDITDAVALPVIARARIGHFAEAQILQALGVDMVDESEELTRSDDENHINKFNFKVPFICGARDLGEALRRIAEGAAMIRTYGDMADAVRCARTIRKQIQIAQVLNPDDIYNYAKELRVPVDLVQKTAEVGRLPVVYFAAGGIATPADVSMMMQLGVDGVFVGSGILKSSNAQERAKAMVQAFTRFNDAKKIGELSRPFIQPLTSTTQVMTFTPVTPMSPLPQTPQTPQLETVSADSKNHHHHHGHCHGHSHEHIHSPRGGKSKQNI